jgi:hypothetical protein
MLAVQMAESSGVVYVYAVARQRHWTCCLAPLSALGRASTAKKFDSTDNTSTSPPLLHSHRQQLLNLAQPSPRPHSDTQITTLLLIQHERSHQSERYVALYADTRLDRLGGTSLTIC